MGGTWLVTCYYFMIIFYLLPAEANPLDDIFSCPQHTQEGPGSGDIRSPDSFQPKIALSLD